MRLALFVALALLFTSACDDRPETEPSSDADAPAIPFRRDTSLEIVRGGDPLVTLAVEVADTDSARTRGMMQRESFPDRRSGMLFIFERERPQSFWMANTPLSLDLIFADADSQIVDIDRYARPFSQEQIRSDAPAKYVLEVPAGFADSFGITEGDRLKWDW